MTAAEALPSPDTRTFTRPLDELLRQAAERYPLLGWSTPVNATVEQERLRADWSSGIETSPRWQAPKLDREGLADLRRGFDRARATLEATREPWLVVYHARLVECASELALIDAVFTDQIGPCARARFPPSDHEQQADRLGARWRRISSEGDQPTETIATDDERDPRSLVSQMRKAIATHKLGVRVMVRDRIGALAAAGDGMIIVAKNRQATVLEATRVVLHEIEGHVLPRERGRAASHGICTLGSAGASEDEEGRAILLEKRSDLLDSRRRRGLAARHLAARIVERGGTYVDVVRRLRKDVDLGWDDALATASRVFRGAHRRGNDVIGGVARERVYLPSYLRVSEAVTREGQLLERLGEARLSLAARRILSA